MGGSRMTEIG